MTSGNASQDGRSFKTPVIVCLTHLKHGMNPECNVIIMVLTFSAFPQSECNFIF